MDANQTDLQEYDENSRNSEENIQGTGKNIEQENREEQKEDQNDLQNDPKSGEELDATGAIGANRCRPARRVTRDALIAIGKVYEYEKHVNDALNNEEDYSDDGSKFDFFMNADENMSHLSADPALCSVSSPNILMPSLPPLNENDLVVTNNAMNDIHISNDRQNNNTEGNTRNSLNDDNTLTDVSDNSVYLSAMSDITRNEVTNISTNVNDLTERVENPKNHYIKSISDVYQSFQLPKSTRSSIPSLTDLRSQGDLDKKNRGKWGGLVNMSIKCLDQVLGSICPGPSRSTLKMEIANYVIKQSRKKKNRYI